MAITSCNFFSTGQSVSDFFSNEETRPFRVAFALAAGAVACNIIAAICIGSDLNNGETCKEGQGRTAGLNAGLAFNSFSASLEIIGLTWNAVKWWQSNCPNKSAYKVSRNAVIFSLVSTISAAAITSQAKSDESTTQQLAQAGLDCSSAVNFGIMFSALSALCGLISMFTNTAAGMIAPLGGWAAERYPSLLPNYNPL